MSKQEYSKQRYPFNRIYDWSYDVIYRDGWNYNKQNVIKYLSEYFNEKESYKNSYFTYYTLTIVFDQLKRNGAFKRESQNTIITLMLQLRFLAALFKNYNIQLIIENTDLENDSHLIEQFLFRECQIAHILPTKSIIERTENIICDFLMEIRSLDMDIHKIPNEVYCDIFIKIIDNATDEFYSKTNHIVAYEINYDIPVLDLKMIIVILENWDDLFIPTNPFNPSSLYVETVIQRLNELCITNHVNCTLEGTVIFALRIAGIPIRIDDYSEIRTYMEKFLEKAKDKPIINTPKTLHDNFIHDITIFLHLNTMLEKDLINEIKRMILNGEFIYIKELEKIRNQSLEIDDYMINPENGIDLVSSNNDNFIEITRKMQKEKIELNQQIADLKQKVEFWKSKYKLDRDEQFEIQDSLRKPDEIQMRIPMEEEFNVYSYIPDEPEQRGLDRINQGYMTGSEEQIIREEVERQTSQLRSQLWNQYEQSVNERTQQNLRYYGIQKEQFIAVENDLKKREERLKQEEENIRKKEEEIENLKQQIKNVWNPQHEVQTVAQKSGNQIKQETQNRQNKQSIQRKTQEIQTKKTESARKQKTEVQPQRQSQPKRQNVQIQTQGQQSNIIQMQSRKQPQKQLMSQAQTNMIIEKKQPSKTVNEVKKEQPMDIVKQVDFVTEQKKQTNQSKPVSKSKKKTVEKKKESESEQPKKIMNTEKKEQQKITLSNDLSKLLNGLKKEKEKKEKEEKEKK